MTVNSRAATPTQRVAHRADAEDRAHVLAQARRPCPSGTGRSPARTAAGGRRRRRARPCPPPMAAIRSAVPRFGSRSRKASQATNSAGSAATSIADPPAEDRRRAPPPRAMPRPPPAMRHHLLDRERLPALLGRVVVAEQAGGRRLGDGLAEAEGRADADQHREAERRRAPSGGEARPDRPPSGRWPGCGSSGRPGSRPAR